MTLGEALRAAVRRLSAVGTATPALDARVMAAAATGLDEAALIRDAGEPLKPGGAARFEAMLVRRLDGEPVARILGRREFWGLDFAVDDATLVPRPDSETVVEAALAEIDAGPGRDAPLRLLDLGVGSGCLLVALLSELPEACGVGVDLDARAAATARANAWRNGVGDRAAFVVGAWAASLAGPFDVACANPPYVATARIATLERDVRAFEPQLALDGGADGLDAYRGLLPEVAARLAPGGVLVLELGEGQHDAVAALARAAGLTVSGTRRDLSGIARALMARQGLRNGTAETTWKDATNTIGFDCGSERS